MTLQQITIRKISDMHVHFRRNELLEAVVPESAKHSFYVVPMPNAGVYNATDAVTYEAEIMAGVQGHSLRPVMSIYITPKTKPKQIYEAHDAGVKNGKIYPKDLTHNSEDGVEDYKALLPVLKAMEKCDMVLSLHGENPGSRIYCVERERRFLPIVRWIARECPCLRIVLEHITTMAAVECVKSMGPNVAATITLHHLYITLNDVMEPKLHPHLYCKPLAKRHTDMMALRRAAFSGNPKFFFGSDTAPHLRSLKECSECCAGTYTAPVIPALLAQLFAQAGQLNKLENFASLFGPMFYRLPAPEEKITIVKKSWLVPDIYPVRNHPDDGIVPFWAGKVPHWQLA